MRFSVPLQLLGFLITAWSPLGQICNTCHPNSLYVVCAAKGVILLFSVGFCVPLAVINTLEAKSREAFLMCRNA